MPQLVGQPLDAPFGFVDRVAVFLQRNVLRREGKAEIGEPPSIRPGPSGAPGIATALPEQERLQAMFRLRAQTDGVFSRTHQIAQRFIIGRRDVDSRELARAMQPGERVAIAPVGLDPIAASFRHARGIDDDAVFSLRDEKAVNAKPARTGFIHKSQPSVRRTQRPDDFAHRLQVPRDHAVVPDLAVSPLLCERHVDRFLVDIHPHEHATFRHGLPPLYVALRVTLIGVAQSTTYYVRQASAPTAILSRLGKGTRRMFHRACIHAAG